MIQEIHLGILATLGLCIAGGVIGAWLFQKVNVPQVVGYIVIGVLLGDTGLGLLRPEDVASLRPFNNFALGLIGFLVGGELSGAIFRKYGKQFTTILLGEGLGAFFLVGFATTGITWLVLHNFTMALAAGVVFGAIASATDPASTIDVLWEYRSAGVLTTAIIAIVALDDALAMTLYGVGTSVAGILAHSGGTSVGAAMLHTGIELGGAIVLGVVAGIILNAMMHYMPQSDKRLGISVGIILLCIGLAVALDMDLILSTMTVGIMLINLAPKRSKKLFDTIRTFSTPIYIVFFVLIGARLSLKNMPLWLWGLIAAYILMRSIGKWLGAYWGGRLSHAEKPVVHYMGMALFAQGGVAVGLSIMAAQNLRNIPVNADMSLGDMVIFTVTATTLCVQLIGPAFTKLAIRRAGEIGRNVTEEDIMEEWRVTQVMDTEIEPLRASDSLEVAIKRFAERETFVYPVVSRDERIIGVLTFDMIKTVLTERDTWHWLIVEDVMQPSHERLVGDMNLGEALRDMQNMQLDIMPVVESEESGKLLGVLELRAAHRALRAEVVRHATLESLAEQLCSSDRYKVYLENDDKELSGVIQAKQIAMKILELTRKKSEEQDMLPAIAFVLNASQGRDLAAAPVTVQLDTTIDQVLDLMVQNYIREIAVIDANGRLVGTLDAKNILSHYLQEKSTASL